MTTNVASAAELLTAIDAALGTTQVAISIYDGVTGNTLYLHTPQIVDANMPASGSTVTITAYSGKGSYSDVFLFLPATAIFDRAGAVIMDRAGAIILTR